MKPDTFDSESLATPASVADNPAKSVKKHRKLFIFLGIILAIAIVVSAGFYVLAEKRIEDQKEGTNAVSAPDTTTILGKETPLGEFSATVSYTSLAAPKDAQVKTSVLWNDDWFFEDSSTYNHDLATTCSILSAIANSESSYYQAGSGDPPYMEDALGDLGFDYVSTSSYEYRSEVIDEIVNFFTNSTDVVAYSIGVKKITQSQTGETATLLLVSVRGSYGSEWLSDANLGDVSDLNLLDADHKGFEEAAEEIYAQLMVYVSDLREKEDLATDNIRLLFTGHSRGAAVANLLASYADKDTETSAPMAGVEAIYAYTFACPNSTMETDTKSTLYNNIFNILNPSDMVPRLPLSEWGYSRYGCDLWLPEPGMENFEAVYESMQAHFLENVENESPSDPTDVDKVDKLESDLSSQIATAEDFETLGGIAHTVKDLAFDVNVVRVLYSHYPNTYIAWMQATTTDNLRTVR